MWSDRKPWWQKKAKDNQTDTNPKKTWCVIKIAVGHKPTATFGEFEYIFKYKPCPKVNVPTYWTDEGKAVSSAVMDNLTKHEAYCCAKGLNFFEN